MSRMATFRWEVANLWYRTLRRRSQRSRLTQEPFAQRLACLLPTVQVLHPYPDIRFDAKYSNIPGRNRVR